MLKLPQMLLFDYGHTLLYEPGFDFLRAEEEVFKHIKSNPRGITPAESCRFGLDLFERYQEARHAGFELHEWQTLKTKYDYLGIELDISIPEAEEILWTAASPGACVPHVHDLLACLKGLGIRSGIISNIGWSGTALKKRIDRLLPENEFEFVIASSECGLRKPDRFLFDLALRKAELSPSDVWHCGDSVKADVYGAHGAGIFPVLYEESNTSEGLWFDNTGLEVPFPHLHIRSWTELIALFESADPETAEIQF